ncbi:YoaK family protein [Lactovum odontotermitis]
METQFKRKLFIILLLVFNAGFVDGYAFFYFDQRFADMMTGNMIQAGICLVQWNIPHVWNFVIPIIFFTLGVMFREAFSHWLLVRRKFDTLYLILVQMCGIAVITVLYNTVWHHLSVSIFVGILSFFMAIQDTTFSQLENMNFGSVLSTANLKRFATSLTQLIITRDRKHWRSVWFFGLLILVLFVGVIFSGLLGQLFKSWTLMGSAFLLLLVYFALRTE